MHILDYLTLLIIDKFGLNADTVVATAYRKREEILIYDLILATIAEPSSVEKASVLLNSSKTYVLAYLKKFIHTKPSTHTWSVYLLKEIGYKYCNGCQTYQSIQNFSNDGNKKVGRCKECVSEYQEEYHSLHPEARSIYYKNNRKSIIDRVKKYRAANKEECATYLSLYYKKNKDSGIFREYAANRRARKLHATPSWANLDIIKRIYENAEGMHVDHIIPLQGELVCGLHVENNLQYLTAEENLRKSNTFIVE